MMTLEQLLAPISTINPVGDDLRQDPSVNALYYQIKDARNTARDLERQQIMGNLEVTQQPRWDQVLNLCEDALIKKTKDLEVSAWYIEALVRKQGFAGLAHGFTVTSQLAETYWDTVFPLADDEGFEKRLTTLMSLCGEDYEGTLIQPIYQQYITQGDSLGPYALWQYQQALDNQKIENRKNDNSKSQAKVGVTLANIKIAVQESKPEFYVKLEQDLQKSKLAFQNLAAVIAKKCPTKTLVTSQINEALEKFADHIRYLLKDAPFSLPSAASADVVKPLAANEILVQQPTLNPSSIRLTQEVLTREEALAQLAKIAALFRRIEPQSPLPYLLDRTIYLAKLPFHELLQALVNDVEARQSAYDLLGIQEASISIESKI